MEFNMLRSLMESKEEMFMSSESNSIENTFQNAGNDIRNRFSDIASKVRADAQEAKDAMYKALEQQCEFAAETLSKAGKKATDLSRRYPLQIIAAALALGFLIGRSRR
jgi:ElaB/YqjD/DUF883 family membrane-anchored ribosome-binding protein